MTDERIDAHIRKKKQTEPVISVKVTNALAHDYTLLLFFFYFFIRQFKASVMILSIVSFAVVHGFTIHCIFTIEKISIFFFYLKFMSR